VKAIDSLLPLHMSLGKLFPLLYHKMIKITDLTCLPCQYRWRTIRGMHAYSSGIVMIDLVAVHTASTLFLGVIPSTVTDYANRKDV
jgi:hypothetical protein